MGRLIGHELFPGNPSRVTQCAGAPVKSLRQFGKAIVAERAGNDEIRDCYLRAI